LYVVSYDIPDDSRRTHISNILLDFGTRVQRSVFECILGQELLTNLTERLSKAIEEREDSVRVYPVCGSCEKLVRVIGKGKLTTDPDVYVV